MSGTKLPLMSCRISRTECDHIIYCALMGAVSERRARVTAVDNARRTACEKTDEFTLTFNHTHQAVITKELIEIVWAAAALDS